MRRSHRRSFAAPPRLASRSSEARDERLAREQVFALIRRTSPTSSTSTRGDREGTRFKEDLEADSLDLYTLVQELEDTYGVSMSDEQAAQILTVGAGGGVRARRTLGAAQCGPMTMLLAELLDELPEDLARQVFTHASWSERRSDSYARLAFLGDSVLSLAVTTYLYPRLEAERFGAGTADEDPRAGRLGRLLPRGGRAPGAARAAARGGAGGRARERGGAGRAPSGCWRR